MKTRNEKASEDVFEGLRAEFWDFAVSMHALGLSKRPLSELPLALEERETLKKHEPTKEALKTALAGMNQATAFIADRNPGTFSEETAIKTAGYITALKNLYDRILAKGK